jgi:hypothetical protein
MAVSKRSSRKNDDWNLPFREKMFFIFESTSSHTKTYPTP